MPTNFKVTMRCEAGHETVVTIENATEECARQFAGLMDGTSSFYAIPPVDSAWIGRCQYGRNNPDLPSTIQQVKAEGGCGEPFRCTVEPIEEAPAEEHERTV